jgi:hypothetical protein
MMESNQLVTLRTDSLFSDLDEKQVIRARQSLIDIAGLQALTEGTSLANLIRARGTLINRQDEPLGRIVSAVLGLSSVKYWSDSAVIGAATRDMCARIPPETFRAFTGPAGLMGWGMWRCQDTVGAGGSSYPKFKLANSCPTHTNYYGKKVT